MKRCPYCGAEYPDDATECAADQRSLSGPVAERKKISGLWRGAYGVESPAGIAGNKAVPFTLKLEQGWIDHFTGTVTEDGGMPGIGAIDGYFEFPTIEFTKQMPVCYMSVGNDRLAPLREVLTAQGHECKTDFPHPPIYYEGTFLDANRVQGRWVIRPTNIRLADGCVIPMPEVRGIWCAEFVTGDLEAVVTESLREPAFDKSLLAEPVSAPDSKPEASLDFISMGKFNVSDAKEILGRLENAGLRFEIDRDDSEFRQMMPFTAVTGGYAGTAPMIEIFVHPGDEAKALDLMAQ